MALSGGVDTGHLLLGQYVEPASDFSLSHHYRCSLSLLLHLQPQQRHPHAQRSSVGSGVCCIEASVSYQADNFSAPSVDTPYSLRDSCPCIINGATSIGNGLATSSESDEDPRDHARPAGPPNSMLIMHYVRCEFGRCMETAEDPSSE